MAKNYTVIELSELLKVPRTTINDWLSRHAQYIESVMIGKRRVFPENSLSVLREISELRNKGMSSSEITEELAKNHPVLAEDAEKSMDNPTEQSPASGQIMPRSAAAEEYSLIAQKQSEELAQLIAGTFSTMSDRLSELENQAKDARKRLLRGWFLTGTLLVMLLLVLIFALYLSVTGFRDMSHRTGEIRAETAALQEKSVNLAGSQEEVKKGIAELNAGLAAQKKELAAELEKSRNAREKEMILFREQAAAQKKEYLQKIEELSKAVRKANEEKLAAEKELKKMQALEKKGK